MPERRLSIPGPAEYRNAMVNAFLAGRKTQVRLPVKPPPVAGLAFPRCCGTTDWWELCQKPDGRGAFEPIGRSPFGVPEDVLWIPETWRWYGRQRGLSDPEGGLEYRADLASRLFTDLPDSHARWADFMLAWKAGKVNKWRPWTQMPRELCRPTLTRRVVDVQIQAVQEIGIGDMAREGAIGYAGIQSPTVAFAFLWDARYAGTPFAWGENPWVWVGTLEKEGA